MAWHKSPTKADKLLGKKITELRNKRGLSLVQLSKKIRLPYQQIERYEEGMRLPVDILQVIAEALDAPIQKRIIRKMVFYRKLEAETKMEQDELLDYYEEAFIEDDFVIDDE